MNIYILNWRDIRHPLAGGAEISLWEHAKYWQKKGINVYWFCSAFPQCLSEEVIDGIQVIRQGSHFTVHIFAFFFFMRKKLHAEDIVVDSFHFLPFFTPFYIRSNKVIALINETARELWFKNLPFPFSFLGYILEPFFFLFYKKVSFITGSQSAKDDVIKFGIEKDHIKVINHGFNPPPKKMIKQKEKYPTVLFLSRLTKDKGIEDAVRAVSSLRETLPQLRFWIVGKSETKAYNDYINDFIKQENIADITTLFGYISEEKKYELLCRAWVLLHPSIREGWGLNVIEANACGTVAVAYSVQGLVDSIKNNKTGLLVGNIHPDNLVNGLKTVLTDKKKRTTLEKNALSWSQAYSWDKAGERSWQAITSKK